MAYANAYERLYDVMKTNFTVIKNNCEYTLGEYMAQKVESAMAKKAEKENAAKVAISSVLKSAEAVKSKATRKFPLRTLASACLSTLVVCSLVLSFGLFATQGEKEVNEIVENFEDSGEGENISFEIKQ